MKNSWVKGLDDQKKADIEASFKAASLIRKRLAEILQEKLEVSSKHARSKVTYDNPNWAYLQADQVGYERCLQEIIELL